MVKFNKERAATSSPLEGLACYRESARQGRLREISVPMTHVSGRDGLWRRLRAEDVRFKGLTGREPLETGGFVIAPREPVVDELTRHRTTPQVFLPLDGPLAAVVGASLGHDADMPDPEALELVPLAPGEAVQVESGVWHTLPFAFVRPVRCLTIMYREGLDAYHDIRDLPALGWVGLPCWGNA